MLILEYFNIKKNTGFCFHSRLVITVIDSVVTRLLLSGTNLPENKQSRVPLCLFYKSRGLNIYCLLSNLLISWRFYSPYFNKTLTDLTVLCDDDAQLGGSTRRLAWWAERDVCHPIAHLTNDPLPTQGHRLTAIVTFIQPVPEMGSLLCNLKFRMRYLGFDPILITYPIPHFLEHQSNHNTQVGKNNKNMK